MKTKLFALSILFLMLATSLSLAQDPIAVVVNIKGDVTVQYQKTGNRQDLKRGNKLYSGAIIVAKEKSTAALVFVDDKSLVRIRPNSILTVSGQREKNTIAKNISIEVGTIFSQITKPRTSFQVTTPTSVASVKGTSFWTRQVFRGGTYYYGDEGGPTEVSNKAGSALFRADETCYVASENAKPVVQKTKPGEKPGFDDDDSIDEFEFNFENEQGETKTLRFKTRMKK